MKLKSILTLSAALLAAAFFAGCAGNKISEGRYSSVGSEEYVIAQNDLLFLHLRAPEQHPGVWMFWDWAGGYSLDDDGLITPKMDKETWDLWRFYFDFRYEKETIRIIDAGNNNIKTLIREAPMRR